MRPFIFEAYPHCIADNILIPVLLQEVVYETLHALCQRLPEQQAFECDSQVKTYLPKVLQHTPGSVVSRPEFRPHWFMFSVFYLS